MILWHPKARKIRKIMEDFWSDEHDKVGYEFVYTPHIGKAALWETSGHLGFYKRICIRPSTLKDSNISSNQ